MEEICVRYIKKQSAGEKIPVIRSVVVCCIGACRDIVDKCFRIIQDLTAARNSVGRSEIIPVFSDAVCVQCCKGDRSGSGKFPGRVVRGKGRLMTVCP